VTPEAFDVTRNDDDQRNLSARNERSSVNDKTFDIG